MPAGPPVSFQTEVVGVDTTNHTLTLGAADASHKGFSADAELVHLAVVDTAQFSVGDKINGTGTKAP